VASANATGQLYRAYGVLDQAIIRHAAQAQSGDIDVSTLGATQRAAAVEALRAIAEQARNVLLRLVIYDAANDHILSTPLDRLDESESGARYRKIFKEKLDAYPAAKLTFEGQ
jgi:hypothetical protein